MNRTTTSIFTLVAGGVAGLAMAAEVTPTRVSPSGVKAVSGHVYINNATGERVVLDAHPRPVGQRGLLTWDSSAIDPCLPAGFPQHDAVVWVYSALHNGVAGQNIQPDAVGYWQDWMEVPENTSIGSMEFTVHSFVEDPGLVGVPGHDYLFAFTENDSFTERPGAVAHSPFVLSNLFGAEDENNDGVIDFAESRLWVYIVDLSDDPVTVGRADMGGDLTGNGLFNCGFVFGYRQPGVAEGDGLIGRFPELAGLGLENPDGLDPLTFPNIANVGTALVHPSWDSSCYDSVADGGAGGPWPQVAGCDDTPPFPLGASDAFGLINALGTEVGAFWFGGFTCSPEEPPPSPPFSQPWTNPWMRFNYDYGPVCCNQSDINCNGVLDLTDITLFITAFLAEDPIADMAQPYGSFDLADIAVFLTGFLYGCP